MPATALTPSDPRQFGTYRLLDRLGAGGMGVVYRAEDPTGRLIALKLMRSELADDPAFCARFTREIATSRAVSSRHTVAILDAGTEDGRPYLATEYIDGLSLADRIASGPMAPDEALALARELAAALGAIHAAGVVHRDLKPSNVLLSADGVKVIDFGIAQMADATALTRTGISLGTPGYLAPEQVMGTAGPAADIFSWAITVAHAATGHPPFGTGPTDAVLYRILHAAPDLSGLPPTLLAAVQAASTKDPTLRPTSTQLQAMLTNPTSEAVTLVHTLVAPASPAPVRHQGHRRRWLILAGAGICAAGIGALIGLQLIKSAHPNTPVGKAQLTPAPKTLGLAAPTSRTTPSQTPSVSASETGMPTQVVRFEPWGDGSQIASGVTVDTTVNASHCTAGAEGSNRIDAYRCWDIQAASSILDPCFPNPQAGNGGSTMLLCPDPGADSLMNMVLVNVAQPIPPGAAPASPIHPMQIILSDGDKCIFAQGATGATGGLRLNYACTTGALFGEPDTSGPVWKIRIGSSNLDGADPGLGSLRVVDIAAVYE